MGIVACQAIGGYDHHGVEFPTPSSVPQAIQGGSIAAASTDAFIEIGVLGQ
jgi:hypothetical protein